MTGAAPAVVHHAALPPPGSAGALGEVPRGMTRKERLALAARLLAAGAVLLEADLWGTVAGVRGAGLDGQGRLVLGRVPVALDPLLRRLGDGQGGFARACARYAAAVWHRLRLAPLSAGKELWGLDGVLQAVLDELPRPLPAEVAEALWGLAVRPLPVPAEGEVRCFRAADRGLARRLGMDLVRRVREAGAQAWLLETGQGEGSTAPSPPVGGEGLVVVTGVVSEADMEAVQRWADRARSGAVVVGELPPGWGGAEEPTGAAPRGSLILVGGEQESRDEALAVLVSGCAIPGALERPALECRARWVWERPPDGESGARGRLERVLGLSRDGLPEGVVCVLAETSPAELRRGEAAGRLVTEGGRWRLADPGPLEAGPLHLEVAELFPAGSPERLLHQALGGGGIEPLETWLHRQLMSLNGAAVRRLLRGVKAGALGPAVELLRAQACLLEVDGFGADRALEGASGPGSEAVRAWRKALDRPADWDPHPLAAGAVAAAPLAAGAMAVAAWRRETRRGRAPAAWVEQVTRAEGLLEGAARRWLVLHRLSLERPGALKDEGRAVAGDHPRLRREWLQLRALEEWDRGRRRASRRGLTVLVAATGEGSGPGWRGLRLLDLGALELSLGRSGRADRIHLRALRLLEAAGLPGRAAVAAFNLAVSEIDRLELDAAEERLDRLPGGEDDPFVVVERARLAFARGDPDRCRELLARVDRGGAAPLREATAFLEGALALLSGNIADARKRLEAGAQEGRDWLVLLNALEGTAVHGERSDGWGVLLAARLLSSGPRDLETLLRSPLAVREALAVALCAVLAPGRVEPPPEQVAEAAGRLEQAGMTGWAGRLRGRPSPDRLVEALAWVAEMGMVQGLPEPLSRALLGALGVEGLELRWEGGRVRLGTGEPHAAQRAGRAAVIPLGAPGKDTPPWRLLLHLLSELDLPAADSVSSASDAVPGLVGSSAPMDEVRRDILELAGMSLPVLITGETGTGKELAARALHALSGRRGRFVALNVAAVPENLVETELFGSVKGAFTGAEARQGLAAAAEGGTLFLDEIGELEFRVQAKLLRFLETSEVRPVGSTRSRRVDVRIVSATHQDLERLVEEGRFRRDLYYRIATTSVHMPSLRERPEDIPELVEELAGRLVARGEVRAARWTRSALARLARHDWPGNVRELGHVVAVALARARGGPVRPEHLPVAAEPAASQAPPRWAEALDRLRADLVRTALERAGGNRTAAARELGISRQTLLYHMARLGIG